jgi:hypothetical protein
MKNQVFFIEWKGESGKYIPIDYENERKRAVKVMQNYKKLNAKYIYRIKKYVSE